MVEKYYNELLPLGLYKEAFVKFYGEQHRNKIEGFFRNANFILVPIGLESYELGKHKKENLPEFEGLQTDHLIDFLRTSGSVIKGDMQKVDRLKNTPVFQRLGMGNLFVKNEGTQQYEWASEEVRNEFIKRCSSIRGNCNYFKLDEEFTEKYSSNKKNIKEICKKKEDVIKEIVEFINKNRTGETMETSTIEIEVIYEDMLNNLNETASHHSSTLDYAPIVSLQIYGDLSLETILHEMNHLIQNHKKFPDSNTLVSGFNCTGETVPALEGSTIKSKQKYEYLNEIVNEYLTQEMLKETMADPKFGLVKNYPLAINRQCAYSRGVELFKPFLDKYKDTLKQAVICNDPMVFRDKILGDKNFDKLAEFANTYLSADEPKYLKELSTMLGKQIKSSQDVLANMDEISRLKLSGNLSKFVSSVENAHKLCNKCVKNHDRLMRGDKINMVGEWENEFTYDQTREIGMAPTVDGDK